MSVIILPKLKCRHCGHEWVPRQEKPPERCVRCQRKKWEVGVKAATTP